MMPKATVTSKGQITVPKVVRERMGLRPGDAIEFVEDNGCFVLRKKLPEHPFAAWRGYLKEYLGRSSDELVDEMRGHDHRG